MSRRGRNRKSGRRHPGGKLVQVRTEDPADKARGVVVEARQRVYGLSAAQAVTHAAGSLLGRLWLEHDSAGHRLVSLTQFEAGEEYRRIVEAYHWAIGVRPLSSSGDLNRGRSHEGDTMSEGEIRARKMARAAYNRCRRVLLNCRAPLAYMVVDAVVMHERDMPGFVGDLRAGLDALAKVLRIERREAA